MIVGDLLAGLLVCLLDPLKLTLPPPVEKLLVLQQPRPRAEAVLPGKTSGSGAVLADRAGRTAQYQRKAGDRLLARRQAAAKLPFKGVERATGHAGIVAAAAAIIVRQNEMLWGGLRGWRGDFDLARPSRYRMFLAYSRRR